MRRSHHDSISSTTSPASPTTSPHDRSTGRGKRIGWGLHWLLRHSLAAILALYGWFKILMIQMGHADVGEALIRYGEMSPQGLLWKMVAYSPSFQILAGVAELTAALLLVWRRSAWLGAALAAFDMSFVFLLNVGYDVPVKVPSLIYALMAFLILSPYVPHLVRIVVGRGVPPMPVPTVFSAPRRFARLVPPLATLLLLGIGVGSVALGLQHRPANSPIAGVYRVTSDSAAPAPQLSADGRWQEVAFGDRTRGSITLVTVRRADGRLLYGRYRIVGDGVAEVIFGDELRGAHTPWPSQGQPQRLDYARLPDGGLRLTGGGQDVTLTPDHEGRFLFDRGFRWDPVSVIR